MTQVQTLTTGGQVTWLTRTTLVVEATIAEIQDLLAAAERSGRLDKHSDIVPVAGEPGTYLVNVRLIPRPTPSRALVPATRPRSVARPIAVATRPQGVVAKRSTGANAAIAVGSVMAAGVVVWGCVEVYELIAEYFVAILGVGVMVLAILLIGAGRRRASCSGVHVKH